MPVLFNPKTNITLNDFSEIQTILSNNGVFLDKWEANAPLSIDANESEILKAYSHKLNPFMEKFGYQSADVINVNPKTENLFAIREKFINEHTHSENEIRFFVDGQGEFWFHLDNDEVFRITCTSGDFISVPKNVRHWFDLAPIFFVKAIRIFTDTDGWTPHYTNSGLNLTYSPRI